MEKCKECIYYEVGDSYSSTGYCLLHRDYMKDYEFCEDFEEGD